MIGLALSPGRAGRAPHPDPLAGFFAPPRGRHVGLARGPQAGLAIWTETGPGMAACLRYDGMQPAARWSWRETLICALRKIYPVGRFALGPGWTQAQTSGSGLAGSYVGNRAVSSTVAGTALQVSVVRDAAYDLWVYYTGRSGGGYCRVEIDGGQDLVNQLGDPAGLGHKAFSTHTATDMQRRRAIRVASGLTGAHVVRLVHAGPASPGGGTVMIEALGLSADLTDSDILPPVWQPGQAYVMGDEVRWAGTYYAARATGVSGALPPAHLTGIGSDGGLDWRADNRPTYPQFLAVDYASEREYAARLVTGGQVTEVGGQTHGHDMLLARSLTLDGIPVVLAADGSLQVGTEIALQEDTAWQRTDGGMIAACTLQRRITAGRVAHQVAVTATGPAAQIDWLYAGMLPLVHWDGEQATTAVATVVAGDGTAVALAGYAGAVGPDVALAGARIELAGATPVGDLRLGCAVVAAAPLTLTAAFLRPNIDARTAAGSADWTAKAYVQASLPQGRGLQPGDVLRFASSHALASTAQD